MPLEETDYFRSSVVDRHSWFSQFSLSNHLLTQGGDGKRTDEQI